MVRKVYKEGYKIIVDLPISEELKYSNATYCSFGFDKDPSDNDVVWVRNNVSGRYIYNGLCSDMTDEFGLQVGDKESVRGYLLGIIGDSSSTPKPTEYKISTERATSEYITLASGVIVDDGNGEEWYIETEITNNINDNSQTVIGSADSSVSRVRLLGGGKIQLYRDSSNNHLSPSGILPSTGTYVLRLEHKADDTTDVFNDGELVYTIPAVAGSFYFNYFGRHSATYLDGGFKYFDLNGDVFPMNEGTGDKTYSRKGTEATLLSSGTVEDMWETI